MSDRDYNVTTRKLRQDRGRVGVAVFGLNDSGINNESDITCKAWNCRMIYIENNSLS